MTARAGIGNKRLVVGAHYGLRGWLLQRVTAVIIGAWLVGFGLCLAVGPRLDYVQWASYFAPLWMKVLTLIVLGAVYYHAWIGIRDIWMDYVKPTGIRLALSVATVLWLLVCAVWTVQILWRV